MYTITYNKEIEESIKSEYNENIKKEIVILAAASKEDKLIKIDVMLSILGEGQTDLIANIEPEIQLKLMKYCDMKEKIPVMLHNHIYAEKEVSFSPIDMKFIEAFRKVQDVMQYRMNSLFLVYGAGKAEMMLMLDGNKEDGKVIDTINYKGKNCIYEEIHSQVQK